MSEMSNEEFLNQLRELYREKATEYKKATESGDSESLTTLKSQLNELEAAISRVESFIDWKKNFVIGDTPGVNNVVFLGIAAVDSGQLMITDPRYVEDVWEPEWMKSVRRFKDTETGVIYQQYRDFTSMRKVLPSVGQTVTAALRSGRLREIKPKRTKKTDQGYAYTYEGACSATQHGGAGQLVFPLGHAGAAVAFSTPYGDGGYAVFAELKNGQYKRIYVEVS